MSTSGSALQFGSPEYLRQVSAGTHPPAMFASAREIVDTHHLGDMDHPVSMEDESGYGYKHYFDTKHELLQHKVDDNPDVSDSIAEHGFDWEYALRHDSPPTVRNDTVVDGHHRIAAMYAYRPDEYMPITTER